MKPVNQVTIANRDQIQATIHERLQVAAETLCRLRGRTAHAMSGERSTFRTNIQQAYAECSDAFWIAEALRIAGLGGTNVS